MFADVHQYTVDGLMPRAVERPNDETGAAALLRRAAAERQAVIPWGAGTKQRLGNVPRAYDIALDLSAFDQIVEYEPADLVLTAQAAVPLRTLQRRLHESGQFLAIDPPYTDTATLGGTLAANASGPSRLLYGTARDLVLGMRVALPNGEVVKSGGKVVKNVVGYDLNKMHIGGLGTLGVMVEVTVKVHPLPAAEATVAATFDRLSVAHEVAGRIVRSPLYPRAVDLVREPAGGSWRILTWASGAAGTVERQVKDVLLWTKEAGATGVARLEGDEHEAAWAAVREFGRAGEDVLLKLTCLPTAIAELVQAVDRHVASPPAIVAHAGTGIVYIALPADLSPAVVGEIVSEALKRGGSGVVEQAPVSLKRELDVWGPTRGDFRLMQVLKAQFDPAGILNPGRFVGGI